jgi:CheY-like chemotaxis protein
MPGEDGLSLIRKIRKMGPKKNGNVAAMALTAYAKSTDLDRSLAAGFNMHMSKPFDTVELAEAILKLSKLSK